MADRASGVRVKYLVRSAALERMDWILDGLDGRPGWGADAAEVISPQFTALFPLHVIVERTRQRSPTYAPVRVVGVECSGHTAKARILNREDGVDIVSCTVEPDPPHRITSSWVAGLVPSGLTPRLPMDFTEHVLPARGEGARLVVFSGLPGSGKSTLADALGRELGIPVFALDWLLGSLTPFGGQHFEGLWEAGAEMLTTLALRQLALGQSAILDHPAEEQETRERWRTLAQRAGADFKVIACTCPDPRVHRARLENRKRDIPGWHDGGNWDDVQRRLAAFPPWTHEALTIDTTRPHEANLAAVIDYLRG